ncbi:NAD(P)/FAD-dependent oxidoreductase [Marinimicrobium sp. ABcell2]|uniref:NAD(P)/FAD-dependent oxidoreductase n=1 Tax=Marinimicrobium sp. ABcell2 TaxID=3069751 RepID=UPI0027B231D5|nr:NAD(P)/FAD-dependent oxidoreductase [Marinimicrobium sp. ABcell2]MDQ2076966.1 NAD(P)/FAD-dependent oxidoreductase [Marinimicrobium sp. ABcell2]
MASIPAQVDVVVIGAGPSGAIASALLHQKGYSVLVLEREYFPRFSIGESLLPQCMVYIEEAGMLEAVQRHGFQYKNGAAFGWKDRYTFYDFRDKFSPGPGTTFQVDRASFDKLLADEATAQGVDIRYGHTIVSLDVESDPARVGYIDDQGKNGEVSCRFVLDASGFGRVASRLLDLEEPSDFPPRQAAFTHIDDHIDDPAFDREKILVTVHPQERDIWYWLIPFSDGRCSLGVVASEEKLARRAGPEPLDTLQTCVAEAPVLAKLLSKAEYRYPSRQITGYACNVKRLAGDRFALLGNAGEFLDPVFSSGVTIAMRSASKAAAVLDRQLKGETVDWQAEYEQPLRAGVDTFRVFVESWYDGLFQDVIFFPDQAPSVRQMISSILAGYAWDRENPIVAQPKRRMQALGSFCAPTEAK